MPIAVSCPGCSAKMRAPDAAAGKKVKCPKCQGIIAVPAADGPADFEVVDENPAPAVKKPAFGSGAVKSPIKADVGAEVADAAPTKPKPKAVVADDDDEDEDEKPKKKKPVVEADDEDDDRPAKKKKAVAEDDEDEKPRKKKRAADDDEGDDRPTKKKKKKRAADDDEGGTSMARNVIGGVVLLILLGVAGYIFYDRYGKKEETASTPPSGDAPPTPPKNPPGRPPGRPQGGLPGTPDGFQEPTTAENELKRLKGTWQLVSIAGNGKFYKWDQKTKPEWHFDGNTVDRFEDKRVASTITVDPTKLPATIDLKDPGGEVTLGIYRFAGNNKLTVCLGKASDATRPTDFTSPAGSEASVIELERGSAK